MKNKKDRSSNNDKWLIRGVYIAILILYILLFLPEIRSLFNVIYGLLALIFSDAEFPLDKFDKNFYRGVYILITGFLCYQIGIILISQFLLPASNQNDRKLLIKYFRLFRKKTHRDPIWISAAQIQGEKLKQSDHKPTIAVIDLNSALVLEKRISVTNNEINGSKAKQQITSNIRVCGPGLNFIHSGETVKGVADIRPQIRINPNVTVKTRDGIELNTNISIIFSIGQIPDEVLVTFADQNKQEIKVIGLSDQWVSEGTFGQMTRVIAEFKPLTEIDPDDRMEIFHYYYRWRSNVKHLNNQKINNITQNDFTSSPYAFDPVRVSSAIYSRAHASIGRQILPWTELPSYIATEILRDGISKVKFDELYLPDDPDHFPLEEFQMDFSKKVRNQGILSYRFVERLDGQLIEVGQIWNEEELDISPSQNFRRQKILRDRGIKVLSASFSQLEPNAEVKEQILDYWKARWEKHNEIIKAENELEAMRIQNRARAIAQKELAASFVQIFDENDPLSNEILAFKIMQTLEVAATDPATRKLLPRETINMLWDLRQWLLPEKTGD